MEKYDVWMLIASRKSSFSDIARQPLARAQLGQEKKMTGLARWRSGWKA
jgi:hypothetical protein